MQTVRAADTNEVVKLIFRESDNDRKVTRGRCVPSRAGRGDRALSTGVCSPCPNGPYRWQVMLQLEKKLFEYFNQEVFRDDNGTAVSPASAVPPMPPWPRFLVPSQPRGPLLNRPSLLEITQHVATVLLRGLPQLSARQLLGQDSSTHLSLSPLPVPHLSPAAGAPSPPSRPRVHPQRGARPRACHSPTGRG